MNYTRSQLHERISDLSGMLRAAQENKRQTSEKRKEDERLADLSRQADEKADALLADVVAQLREAKASYADAVEEIIAVPGAPIASEEPAHSGQAEVAPIQVFDNVLYSGAQGANAPSFWTGDVNQDAHLTNGLNRIGEALEEARR